MKTCLPDKGMREEGGEEANTEHLSLSLHLSEIPALRDISLCLTVDLNQYHPTKHSATMEILHICAAPHGSH